MSEAASSPKEPRLTGPMLAELGPFLWVDQIQAGDVLLTRGAGLGATMVAIASRGPYSHAAIWIPTDVEHAPVRGRGWHNCTLVESDPFGVGPTVLETLHLSLDGGRTRLAARLPGVRSAVVRRLPETVRASDTDVVAAAEALTRSEFYKSYAARQRLANAVALPKGLKPLARRGLALGNPADVTPGMFCSELVAQFFANLALPLFEPAVPPETISPSRLAEPSCRLVDVEGAIVLPEALGPLAYGELPRYARPTGLDRSVMLPSLVKQRHVTNKFSAAAAELSARAQAQRLEQSAAARAQHERVMTALLSYAVGPPLRSGWARAIPRLLARAMWIRALDRRLEPLESAGFPSDDLPLHCVTLALRQQYHCQRFALEHDLRRTETLTALQGLRLEMPKKKSQRRKMAKRWRALVENQGAIQATFEQTPVLGMPQFKDVITSASFASYWDEITAGAWADALADLAAMSRAADA